eukprot:4720760-Amphidinium_carterae.1
MDTYFLIYFVCNLGQQWSNISCFDGQVVALVFVAVMLQQLDWNIELEEIGNLEMRTVGASTHLAISGVRGHTVVTVQGNTISNI